MIKVTVPFWTALVISVKRLFPVVITLFFAACVNPYTQFYQGILDARQQQEYEPQKAELQIYKTDNFERDRLALMQRGFMLIGEASFNAASTQVTEEQLREQAQKVGAHVVLVSSKYSHTISGAIPLTIPTTTTSYSTASATAFGSRGTVNAYGSGTTTTYGSQTTFVPYSVARSDFNALFFAKYKSLVGIIPQPLDDESRKRLQSNHGVRVLLVTDESPAFHANILPGDIILGVGGNVIETVENYSQLLHKYEGQTVEFRLDRAGGIIEKPVQIQQLTKSVSVTVDQASSHISSKPNNTIPVATGIATNTESSEWTTKSLQSLQNKQWAEVIRTASIAISLDPSATAPYINRSWAYAEKGLYEKAISDCNTALNINPHLPLAINNRGLSYMRGGQQENAIRDYRQACEMGLEVACNNFKELVGYLPTEETSVLLKNSEKYFIAGDYSNSISMTLRVIALQPSNAEAYSNKCGAEASLGLLKEGKASCQKAIELGPNFSMAYNNLGFILEQEGNLAEASLYYEMSCNLGNEMGCQNRKRITMTK